MAKRNEGVAAEERIDYRIGINLGDVMAEGADIAGDGVNVASRLERSIGRVSSRAWTRCPQKPSTSIVVHQSHGMRVPVC